jgi:hypothetical protein
MGGRGRGAHPTGHYGLRPCVAVDLWCAAAALACVFPTSLQSAAGRCCGIRDRGGLCIPLVPFLLVGRQCSCRMWAYLSLCVGIHALFFFFLILAGKL